MDTNRLGFRAKRGRQPSLGLFDSADVKGVHQPRNASEQITDHINKLADWRGKLLARLRKLILEAAPGIVEEWKWNTPVWSLKKNIVAAGAFQDHVKVNFFQGASLADPQGLFNAGLEAKATRAIDIRKGDVINESALKELIRAAVALESGGAKPRPKKLAKNS